MSKGQREDLGTPRHGTALARPVLQHSGRRVSTRCYSEMEEAEEKTMAQEVLDKVIGKTISKANVICDGRVELIFDDGTSIDFMAMAGGDYDWCSLDVSGPYAPYER